MKGCVCCHHETEVAEDCPKWNASPLCGWDTVNRNCGPRVVLKHLRLPLLFFDFSPQTLIAHRQSPAFYGAFLSDSSFYVASLLGTVRYCFYHPTRTSMLSLHFYNLESVTLTSIFKDSILLDQVLITFALLIQIHISVQ